VERINEISLTNKDFCFLEDFNPDAIMVDAFGIVYADRRQEIKAAINEVAIKYR